MSRSNDQDKPRRKRSEYWKRAHPARAHERHDVRTALSARLQNAQWVCATCDWCMDRTARRTASEDGALLCPRCKRAFEELQVDADWCRENDADWFVPQVYGREVDVF